MKLTLTPESATQAAAGLRVLADLLEQAVEDHDQREGQRLAERLAELLGSPDRAAAAVGVAPRIFDRWLRAATRPGSLSLTRMRREVRRADPLDPEGQGEDADEGPAPGLDDPGG